MQSKRCKKEDILKAKIKEFRRSINYGVITLLFKKYKKMEKNLPERISPKFIIVQNLQQMIYCKYK